MDLQTKRELAALVLYEQHRKKTHCIEFFRPHKAQEQFLRSQAKERWFIGGNRAGKTIISAYEAIQLARGKHPYRKIAVPNRGWLVSLDSKQAMEAIERHVRNMLPMDEIMQIREADRKIVFKNESEITFKSCDSGWEKFQGASMDWIGFDEEPELKIWQECRMRLIDRNGIYWVTMTPTKGITWAYEYITRSKDSGMLEIITASIYDNPHIQAQEIENVLLSQGFTKEQLRARLHGEWVSMSGTQVFPSDRIAELRKHACHPIHEGEIECIERIVDIPYPDNTSFDDDDSDDIIQQLLVAESYSQEPQYKNFRIYETDKPTIRIWKYPVADRSYVIGADPAAGIEYIDWINARKASANPSAAIVFDPVDWSVVAEVHGYLTPSRFAKKLAMIGEYYNWALLVVENNTYGKAVLHSLVNEHLYPAIYSQRSIEGKQSSVLGFNTNTKTRSLLISLITASLHDGSLKCPSKDVIEELDKFIIGPNDKPQAAPGAADDRVIALGLALIGAHELRVQEHEEPENEKPKVGIVDIESFWDEYERTHIASSPEGITGYGGI